MAGVSSKAGSPSFEATFSPSGRETHFGAVLGGEDAVEYLFCGYFHRISSTRSSEPQACNVIFPRVSK